jgi:hypothetical protein
MMSLPSAKLYATDKEIQNAWDEWSKFRICANCGNAFNWLSAFGSWECKQHLGPVSGATVNPDTGDAIVDANGVTFTDWRYWKCCKQRPYTAWRTRNEVVWSNFRKTIPSKHRFVEEAKVPGCIRCDHTEATHILDDGIRLNVSTTDPDGQYSFAPLGGHQVTDTVIYKTKERTVTQVYYDKTFDLEDEEDAGKIPATEIEWPALKEKMKVGLYCDWNFDGVQTPVKILRVHRASIKNKRPRPQVDFIIKNVGMPVHEIAAMIPHMGPNVEDRPGWKFDEYDGQVMFPYIQNAEPRPFYSS